MKFKHIIQKSRYLTATIKAILLFLVIGPIHELVHAITAIILGGKVANISFIPNGFGNLTTVVFIEGYFKQILVALSPGIILGALGFYVTRRYFLILKNELKTSNKINPKIYSSILKITIGIVALIPLIYGLINFLGALLSIPTLYTGDFTTGAFAVEQGLNHANSHLFEFYTLFPESTRILLVALLTTILAAGFYAFLGIAFKYISVAYLRAFKRTKSPNLSRLKQLTYRKL